VQSAFRVAGSKKTVLVEVEGRAVSPEPGWTLRASALSRATTGLPPSLVTAKVSEPAGSTTSMWHSPGRRRIAALRSAPSGSVSASGADAEDHLLALA
jgi:hypothetical protein